MTKTTFATEDDHLQAMASWYIVDASEHVLGRMASRVAEVLMGKHRPIYTAHINVGEGVVVVNASKVKLTGAKREGRIYRSYSGYPGGLKERSTGRLIEEHPEKLITLAVRRMLPKTRMGRAMLSRLKVYGGAEHPHMAQKPKKLEI